MADDRALALFEQYRWVAAGIARKLSDGCRAAGLEREDLEQEALLGLWEAAQRFDPSRGWQFRTYAHHRVRGAVLDACRGYSQYNPRHMKAFAEPRGEGRAGAVSPRDESGSEHEVGSGQHWSETVESRELDPSVAAEWLGIENLLKVRGIYPHERRIVLWHLEGLTLAQIGEVLGKTESRASQIERDVFRRLRESWDSG